VESLWWNRWVLFLFLILAGSSLPVAAQNNEDRAAMEFEQQGKTAEAEAAWNALSKEHPTSAEPYAHLGLLAAHQDHYPQAINYYRKAMALDPAMPGLRLNLGLAYFKSEKYKQAIEIFAPLLKAQSQDAGEAQRLTVLLGMSHYGLGEYAAASPYLKQAAKHDPENLPLLLSLAHSCLLSKQYQCVLDAYHQIVARNADSAEADMLVGEALDEMKDSAGAIREFRAAIAADPQEPNVHFGLGYLLWTQKQYPEAVEEFQAELKNTPGYTQALLYLGDSYVQLNRFEEATTILEKLVKENPALAMAHLDLGIVDAETDKQPDALRELKTAATLKPRDVNVHWRLGRLYRAMGKPAEAKAEFDQASNLTRAGDDRLLDVLQHDPEKAPGATTLPDQQ
jgi:tetratricopeptide (TPR) repeat protein